MPKFYSPSRRSFIGGMTALTVAAPAYIRPSWAQGKQLVVADFPGSVRDARRQVLYDPFTEETGIEIIYGDGPSLANVKVQVENDDVVWDVVRMGGSFVNGAAELGLLERIDESIVDRAGVLPKSEHEFACATGISTGGIAFPTDRLDGNVPKTWPEFWNVEEIPGRRGLRNRVTDTLEIALMGDGVPASEVYPCDVERAFRALDRIKPYVSHWIQGSAETVSLIQQNETDFTYTYASRVKGMQEANVPIGYSLRQNILEFGYWGVPKGTKNRDAAMQFLNFTMQKDRQVALANLTADAPVYADAMALVDPEVQKWLPDLDSPENLFTDPSWWEGNLEELTLRFQEWLLT